ncbi:protein with beta tubulin folding factor domain [Cryptosporidium felis]|nr:protein with beta tubulin folding factor domain [Cryptosporidium felis]
MSFILLPNIEFVSQLYVGLELGKAKDWDEEIVFLYISLLRDFTGCSRFLDYFQWRDFVCGQEAILSKSSGSGFASNVSIAFWTLKRRLLGKSELERLHLFSSESLTIYWIALSSAVLLKTFGPGEQDCAPIDAAEKEDFLCAWLDQEQNARKEGTFGEMTIQDPLGVPRNVSVCSEMLFLFILTQFSFSSQSDQKLGRLPSMYSRGSYIALAKFFQKNSAILLRILSLCFRQDGEAGKTRSRVPRAFEVFFEKIFVGKDFLSEEKHRSGDSREERQEPDLENSGPTFQLLDTKITGLKNKKEAKMELTDFTINAFNYHIMVDDSSEILLSILLNGTSKVINHTVLDDYYLISNVQGRETHERTSYFLVNKVARPPGYPRDEENLGDSGENEPSEREEVIHCEARNIIVANSSRLDLYITRPVSSLYMKDCKDCSIFGLDLIANIKVDNCLDTFLHVDCMFITIERCQRMHLFVHSQFSPLLIDSEGVSLGPYNVHCTNRKTSYASSCEENTQTENWKFPVSTSSSFDIIRPEELFVVELVDLGFRECGDSQVLDFPVASEFFENLVTRKENLELVRKLDATSQTRVVEEFVWWISENPKRLQRFHFDWRNGGKTY